MGIMCAYTAAFWGARYMYDTDALEAVSSNMQAMTLAQELEQMSMDIDRDLDLETNLKPKYVAPKKPAYKPKAYKPAAKKYVYKKPKT